jgi:hypothetical protein
MPVRPFLAAGSLPLVAVLAFCAGLMVGTR